MEKKNSKVFSFYAVFFETARKQHGNSTETPKKAKKCHLKITQKSKKIRSLLS